MLRPLTAVPVTIHVTAIETALEAALGTDPVRAIEIAPVTTLLTARKTLLTAPITNPVTALITAATLNKRLRL